MSNPEPELKLAAVLAAPDGYDAVRRTLAAVHAQAERARIELVLVVPEAASFAALSREFPGFGATRLVAVGPIGPLGPARAAGARAARAPVVVFLEDHAYPAADWAHGLLHAFDTGPWAAVGPVIGNANPESATSWANLLIAYGRWVVPGRAREMDALPGHNSAYRREVLLAEGAALDERLTDEWAFHHALRARGLRLHLTGDARTDHQNISQRGSALRLRYHGGRQDAAMRARGWSPLRRAVHVIAAPLIPLVRLRDVVRNARASGVSAGRLLRTGPALGALLVAAGAGEAAGYALGAGGSIARKARLEHDRVRHLNRADRAEAERLAVPS